MNEAGRETAFASPGKPAMPGPTPAGTIPAETAPPAPGAVHDLPLPIRGDLARWILYVLVLIAVLLPLGLIIPGATYIGALSAPVFVGILALDAAFITWRARRRLAAQHTRPDQPFTADSLAACLAPCAVSRFTTIASMGLAPPLAGRAAALLASQSDPPAAARLYDPRRDIPPLSQPLDVPFEPVPFDPNSPDFRALAGDHSVGLARFRDQMREMSQTHPGGRHLKWLIYFGFFVLAVSVPWFIYEVGRALLLGNPSSQQFVLMAILLSSVAGGLMAAISRSTWLLVPGGVIIRSARLGATRARLQLIRRDEAVIIYWREAHQAWLGCRDGRVFRSPCTPRMADLLLRAWRSPLPPPPPDRLSDLE